MLICCSTKIAVEPPSSSLSLSSPLPVPPVVQPLAPVEVCVGGGVVGSVDGSAVWVLAGFAWVVTMRGWLLGVGCAAAALARRARSAAI